MTANPGSDAPAGLQRIGRQGRAEKALLRTLRPGIAVRRGQQAQARALARCERAPLAHQRIADQQRHVDIARQQRRQRGGRGPMIGLGVAPARAEQRVPGRGGRDGAGAAARANVDGTRRRDLVHGLQRAVGADDDVQGLGVERSQHLQRGCGLRRGGAQQVVAQQQESAAGAAGQHAGGVGVIDGAGEVEPGTGHYPCQHLRRRQRRHRRRCCGHGAAGARRRQRRGKPRPATAIVESGLDGEQQQAERSQRGCDAEGGAQRAGRRCGGRWSRPGRQRHAPPRGRYWRRRRRRLAPDPARERGGRPGRHVHQQQLPRQTRQAPPQRGQQRLGPAVEHQQRVRIDAAVGKQAGEVVEQRLARVRPVVARQQAVGQAVEQQQHARAAGGLQAARGLPERGRRRVARALLGRRRHHRPQRPPRLAQRGRGLGVVRRIEAQHELGRARAGGGGCLAAVDRAPRRQRQHALRDEAAALVGVVAQQQRQRRLPPQPHQPRCVVVVVAHALRPFARCVPAQRRTVRYAAARASDAAKAGARLMATSGM